jgi:hypothetical protein
MVALQTHGYPFRGGFGGVANLQGGVSLLPSWIYPFVVRSLVGLGSTPS